MSTEESPVKASELIEELQDGPIEAEIVDEGDLEPSFWGVEVDVGDDHVCTVKGKYMYKTADCCHGINPGRSEAEVLGVVFAKPILGWDEEEIEISGRDIEYDGDLESIDVYEAAEGSITFAEFDPDNYDFEPGSVTDDELRDSILENLPDGIYVLDQENRVLRFGEDETVPEDCRRLEDEEVADHFVAHRDEIDFEGE